MTALAQSRGRTAEVRVIGDLEAASWRVNTSSELDYGNKVDARTVCPGRRPFDLQVSVGDKSNRQHATLEARGVHPVSVAELDRGGVTAAEFICERLCTRVLCTFDQSPLDGALTHGEDMAPQETPVSICV